jgi:hypothetical protein
MGSKIPAQNGKKGSQKDAGNNLAAISDAGCWLTLVLAFYLSYFCHPKSLKSQKMSCFVTFIKETI